MKWLALMGALSAKFLAHSTCPCCKVKKGSLGSLDKCVCPARTINGTRIAAHLPPKDDSGRDIFPFTCPDCDLTFNDELERQAEELDEIELAQHPSIHQGVMWHIEPVLSDYGRIVFRTLHMRISFCRTLYQYVVLPALVQDESIVDQLLEMFKQDGVNVNRLKKMNDLNDLETCRKASFNGKASYRIIKRFDAYVKLANHTAPEKMCVSTSTNTIISKYSNVNLLRNKCMCV